MRHNSKRFTFDNENACGFILCSGLLGIFFGTAGIISGAMGNPWGWLMAVLVLLPVFLTVAACVFNVDFGLGFPGSTLMREYRALPDGIRENIVLSREEVKYMEAEEVQKELSNLRAARAAFNQMSYSKQSRESYLKSIIETAKELS